MDENTSKHDQKQIGGNWSISAKSGETGAGLRFGSPEKIPHNLIGEFNDELDHNLNKMTQWISWADEFNFDPNNVDVDREKQTKSN